LEIALGARESHRRADAINLLIRGAQGRCDRLSTTLGSEQHDWMELLHDSPELKRESRAGIATVRNLIPERAFSIAPWYYESLSTRDGEALANFYCLTARNEKQFP
jgi:hypothetical protein